MVSLFFRLLLCICAEIVTASGADKFEERIDFEEVGGYDHLHGYEEVTPLRIHGDIQKRDLSTQTSHATLHLNHANFLISAKNRHFSLQLTLNRDIISPKLVEVEVDSNGFRHQTIDKPQHCYYHGFVNGKEDTTVIIHTCHGLKGLFHIEGQTYYIEPHVTKKNNNVHVMYRPEDIKNRRPQTCGVNHTMGAGHFDDAYINHVSHLHYRKKRQASLPKFNQNLEPRYIEMYLVHDYETWKKHPSKATLKTRSLSIANTIDAIYKNMNVRLVLVGIEYWTESNKATVTQDSSTTLDNFQTYAETYLPRNTIDYDVAHLVVGIDVSGSVVGLAYVGTTCSNRGVGISEDTTNEQETAFTIAHEIGHNLGMNHDDSRSCNDCSWSGGCVMSSTATSNPQSLTTCSVGDMNRYTFSCLKDLPTANAADPVCGNGIVEQGEVCDCGTAQECPTVDPCCEITGCKLKNSSQCGSGPCCQSCQFKAALTVCRSEANNCDISEVCTGNSGNCPDDFHKEDGTTCTAGTTQAYCYTGQCRTRDAQCKYLLGNDTEGSTDFCYNNVNIKGSTFGNCGKDSSGNFIACTAENVFCGKLQCQGGSNATSLIIPTMGTTRTGTLFTFTATTTNNSGSFTEKTYCKGGDADLGDDVPNPGMMQDGTKCGDQKMCFKQQCQTFTQLTIGDKCGKVNNQVCAGRGTCNQHGDCVCQSNYDPGAFCYNTTDTLTLLTCYTCADDQICPNTTLLSSTEKCISNYMSCQTVKLDRGQGATIYYTRGCVFTSKCTAGCSTTTQGYTQCAECCTTDRCNNGVVEGSSQSLANSLFSAICWWLLTLSLLLHSWLP